MLLSRVSTFSTLLSPGLPSPLTKLSSTVNLLQMSSAPPAQEKLAPSILSSSNGLQAGHSQLSQPPGHTFLGEFFAEAEHLTGEEGVRQSLFAENIDPQERVPLGLLDELPRPISPTQRTRSVRAASEEKQQTESVHSDCSEDAASAAPAPPFTSNRPEAFGHTTFGLKRKHGYGKPAAGPADPRDYENKYPDDPMYEELAENARVWRVYLDEVADFDADMVEKSSDGLDLLLVFAGLFSAVLTTFVAQTSQSLSTDYSAVSASLLTELVSIQRAIANGASVVDISRSETTSGPSRGDTWVNGLWFIGLTLSLSTALLAVLVRQWLHQYTAVTSGTSRDRSLIRQYRYDGLMKWRVPLVISLLPVILHVALCLFLAGLVIFLIPLNNLMAWAVGFITCIVYAIYAITNVLPLVDPQCPYRTPFSGILHGIIGSVRRLLFSSLSVVSYSFYHLRHTILIAIKSLTLPHQHSRFSSNLPPRRASGFRKLLSLKETERNAATTEEMGVRAIVWLLDSTSNPPATSIALQSLGAFSSKCLQQLPHLLTGTASAIENAMISIGYPIKNPVKISVEHERLKRLLRSRHAIGTLDPSTIPEPLDGYCDPLQDAFSAMSCLLWYNRICNSSSPRTWVFQDLVLNLIDPQTPDIILPQHFWETLQCASDAQHLTLLRSSPVRLLQLYRFAFPSPSPLWLEGGLELPFHVKLTQPPQALMQHLAVSLALKSQGNREDPRSVEGILEALIIISNGIWASLQDVPPHGYYDALYPLAAVWQALTSKCCNADISRPLSESLSNHAVFIIRSLLRLGYPSYLPKFLYEAVHTMGCKVESLTYVELFKDQAAGQTWQGQMVKVLDGARLWVKALEANTTEAYTYLISQDLLSNPQDKSINMPTKHYLYYLMVLPAFVKGLARHSLPPEILDRCHAYLFQPDHLYAACAGAGAVFAKSESLDARERLKETVLALVNLDPKHPFWADHVAYLNNHAIPSPGSSSTASCPPNVSSTDQERPHVLEAFQIVDEYLESLKNGETQAEMRVAEQPLAQTRGLSKLMTIFRPRSKEEMSLGFATQAEGMA
ncbi:hypothetical protein HGRIS_014590 [Hohenbuehelia grisea]|uniref:DUF6535 domain-containing protein n=1 Tax=Hohenbuehelia grisea TaxID=104357 RepID=A0ABR3JTW7_9AGAR